MEVLLDTNALLWIATDSSQLTADAAAAYEETDLLAYSTVNLWEIGLKMSKGGYPDLDIPEDWDKTTIARLDERGFQRVGIEIAHCRAIQDLPFHHKDPFDRMLIAQALHGNWAVMSSDRQFDAYGVERIW